MGIGIWRWTQAPAVTRVNEYVHLFSCSRVQEEVPDGKLELSWLHVLNSQVSLHRHVGLETICHKSPDLQTC